MESTTAISPTKPLRRRWRLLAVAALFGLVFAWGSDRQPADATKFVAWRVHHPLHLPDENVLRIASFNIHGGKGSDGALNLSRIGDELRNVDFAGLYEVHAILFGQFADQADELGQKLGLRSAFLATERRWWRDHFGNAVVTSLPVMNVQRMPLIGTRGKAFRQAVLFDILWNDVVTHVLMVHIDSQQDREPQLRTVIDLFQALNAPAVLMGDLNSGPDDKWIAGLLSQPGVQSTLHVKLGDAAPKDNIDWIITRGLECVDTEYVDRGASDHPVVKATLRIQK